MRTKVRVNKDKDKRTKERLNFDSSGCPESVACLVRSMKFGSIDEIRQSGFEGFAAIFALKASACRKVPDVGGVYRELKLCNGG